MNSPGTIDHGYRGEICVILINHGEKPFRITEGMLIAQLVVKPVIRVKIVEVKNLDRSERGTSGFGSTID